MMVLSQAPGGALSAKQYIHKTHNKNPYYYYYYSSLHKPSPPLFSKPNHEKKRTLLSNTRNPPPFLTLAAKSDDSSSSTTSTTSTYSERESLPSDNSASPPTSLGNGTVLVGQEDVPLEGVIQFDRPTSPFSRLDKWGRVGLLAGGDVLALLLFSSIGRFSHGFSVFDYDTLRTADAFVAGWFLGAYFLGGYGEDGRGMNGYSKAIAAAAKSWAVGVPLGLIIRGVTSGHVPPYTFVLVTMASTAVLLIGWRAIASKILSTNETKKDDVYRRGNPFELFELLTSLVRRW